MPGQNSILLEKNGNITIRDVTDGTITIHTNNAQEIYNELRQLNHAQIDSLLQVAPQFKEQLSEQFSSELKNIAREKNVVKGSISNVGTVRIGDEIQYHYHHPESYDVVTLKDAIERDVRANIIVAHNHQEAKIEKVGFYLSSIFSLSRLNEAEIWLLKQFTCLPSTFHPYDLIFELIIDNEGLYKDTFSETITGLVQSGWLLYSNATDSYKMHRIIAEVVKIELNITNSDIRSLLDTICQKLNVDQSKDNPINRFVWIPFGRAILNGFSDDFANETMPLEIMKKPKN